MTIHRHIVIEDTVYFWFGSNDTSGSGDDGAAPLADVRLAGAAAGAAPVLSPVPILLTHVNYPDGCYEVAVDATVANGFVAGNTYAVFCTLTVDAQNPTGFVGSFTIAPIIANSVEISDDPAAADNLELACDNYSVTRGLSGTALPAAVADAAGGLPISDAGGLDLDTKLANTNEVTVARMGALTDWIDGGRLDLLLDAIKAVTDALPDGGALTNIDLNTARLTPARAGVLTDWINDGRLDTILDIIAADVVNLDGDAMRGTNSAALAASYTAARAGYLDELEAANLPADVDTLLTRITAARAGYLDELAAPNLPADIDTLLTRITAARAVYLDELEAANLPADVDTLLTRITAAAALASVCTEARLAELDAANLPADIANVPTEAEMNARTLVAAGYFDPAVDTVAGVTTVVNLTNAPTAGDLTATMKASVNTEADTALTDYAGPTKAEMDAAHGLLATPAEVNAEVLDVLNVDTFAEPGQGAPAATTTLQEKLAYLYKFTRNKLVQSATTLEVYDDAGAVVDQKAAVSDDGVDFTRGEIGSGP